MRIPKPNEGRSFEPAPAGVKPCVLIDIIDLGTVETKFGDKEMLRFVWQTPDEIPGTELNFNVAQRYAVSLHEKSNLRKAVESILGRKMKASDWGDDGYDVEQLVGTPSYISIVHSDPVEKGGEMVIYANVQQIMPLPDGVEAPVQNPAYVRVKDREQRDDDGEIIPF